MRLIGLKFPTPELVRIGNANLSYFCVLAFIRLTISASLGVTVTKKTSSDFIFLHCLWEHWSVLLYVIFLGVSLILICRQRVSLTAWGRYRIDFFVIESLLHIQLSYLFNLFIKIAFMAKDRPTLQKIRCGSTPY